MILRDCCGVPQVICAALADSGLAVSQWRSVEMHGTGTALGDPIEIGAIAAVASRSAAGAAMFTSLRVNEQAQPTILSCCGAV